MKKEYYKLFWEYLKRSDNYKEYCVWKKRNKKYPETPFPQKIKTHGIRFKELYRLFGDIHSESFEKWWTSDKSLFDVKKRTRVRDFKKTMSVTFDRAIEQLKKSMKKEPSAEDLKHYLVQYINSFSERALIEIDLWGQETSKELGEQVGKIISPLRKNKKVKEYARLFNFLYWQPNPGKIKKFKSHIRALEIYDMRNPTSGGKGLSVKEIAQSEYPEKIKEGETEVFNPNMAFNPNLLIYQALESVVRNIKNVERGRFPGDL